MVMRIRSYELSPSYADEYHVTVPSTHHLRSRELPVAILVAKSIRVDSPEPRLYY